MDPTTTLREARDFVAESKRAVELARKNYYRELALEKFRDLDKWLTNGGFLPDQWNFEATAH